MSYRDFVEHVCGSLSSSQLVDKCHSIIDTTFKDLHRAETACTITVETVCSFVEDRQVAGIISSAQRQLFQTRLDEKYGATEIERRQLAGRRMQSQLRELDLSIKKNWLGKGAYDLLELAFYSVSLSLKTVNLLLQASSSISFAEAQHELWRIVSERLEKPYSCRPGLLPKDVRILLTRSSDRVVSGERSAPLSSTGTETAGPPKTIQSQDQAAISVSSNPGTPRPLPVKKQDRAKPNRRRLGTVQKSNSNVHQRLLKRPADTSSVTPTKRPRSDSNQFPVGFHMRLNS